MALLETFALSFLLLRKELNLMQLPIIRRVCGFE